jgi:hypothetical protein
MQMAGQMRDDGDRGIRNPRPRFERDGDGLRWRLLSSGGGECGHDDSVEAAFPAMSWATLRLLLQARVVKAAFITS